MSDLSPPVGGSILPLTIQGLGYTVGGKRLVRDVACTLEAGSRTIVLGPNGAGKSLFLRLCHGLLTPSEGHIGWTAAPGVNPVHAQAMVFQRPIMLRRSAAANIDYALALRKVPRAERARRVADALERTGLSAFAKRPARVMSFGEQQKLAIARAWALRPQILFLDEPTASLDPAATRAIEHLIQAVFDAGTKIVMTTHDMGQARRLADEVLFVHGGTIVEHTPADAFFAQPKTPMADAFLRGDLTW